jgi:hypothetical protein
VDAPSGARSERREKPSDLAGSGGLKCFTPPPTSNGTADTFHFAVG